MTIYLILFLISFILSIIFIPFSQKISLKYNFYDNPQSDSLKIHKTPISFLGGGVMLSTLILCLLLSWILKKQGLLSFETPKFIAIFIGSVISWFYGFWDDTYWQQRSRMGQMGKIFFQTPIALALVLILYNANLQWQFIGLPIAGIIVSLLYLLFIINAVNIQDGLDGLLVGLALIAFLGFFVVSLWKNDILGLIFSSAMIGNNFAFLLFNWHPASIFLGNNGSYFLGFLMAVFILMNTRQGDSISLIFPPLILGMPLLNAFYVLLRRAIIKYTLFSADRQHLYDNIYRKVGSIPKAVLLNYLIQIVVVVIGLMIIQF